MEPLAQNLHVIVSCGSERRPETTNRLLCILDLMIDTMTISQVSSNKLCHVKQLYLVGV